MSPLELMQRLAALVPRLHLIRFHGVLAPSAKLRPLVVPQGPPVQAQAATEAAAGAEREVEPVQARPHRINWARLLERVFDIDMQLCPNCGAGELKIIAAILERAVIEKTLTHLGLDPQPPPRGRAREAGHDRSRLSRLSRLSRAGPRWAAGVVLRRPRNRRRKTPGQPPDVEVERTPGQTSRAGRTGARQGPRCQFPALRTDIGRPRRRDSGGQDARDAQDAV